MRTLSFDEEVFAFLMSIIMFGVCFFGLIVALGGCETVHDRILKEVEKPQVLTITNVVVVVTNCSCATLH